MTQKEQAAARVYRAYGHDRAEECRRLRETWVKPLVKVTSHVDPPYSCTYTLAEFMEANAHDMEPEDIKSLIEGKPVRLGGGAAPIVDVVPES
jgi:hypothetical protein